MMTEAHRVEHISTNPCIGIEALAKQNKTRDILRLDEVDALFSQFTQEQIWLEPMTYVGTLLAAATGMRTGEQSG